MPTLVCVLTALPSPAYILLRAGSDSSFVPQRVVCQCVLAPFVPLASLHPFPVVLHTRMPQFGQSSQVAPCCGGTNCIYWLVHRAAATVATGCERCLPSGVCGAGPCGGPHCAMTVPTPRHTANLLNCDSFQTSEATVVEFWANSGDRSVGEFSEAKPKLTFSGRQSSAVVDATHAVIGS